MDAPIQNMSEPSGDQLLEVQTQKLLTEPPGLFKVMLLNDDFTPMDFVVYILCRFFGKSLEMANAIMLKVHYEGKSICGIYPQDIAATKVDLVMAAAQTAGHPLQCFMEAA